MKIYKKQFDAVDLFKASRRPDISVGSTPFGAAPGEKQLYIRAAASWKGIVCPKGDYSLLPAEGPKGGVRAGITACVSASKAAATKVAVGLTA